MLPPTLCLARALETRARRGDKCRHRGVASGRDVLDVAILAQVVHQGLCGRHIAQQVEFEQLFAQRCSNHLSHLDEPGADPLNEVCYMWWDLFPTWGEPEMPDCTERDREVLQVMVGALSLESVACQESVLHGLGHWYTNYPEFVERAIRQYLQVNGPLRPELRKYAHGACQGNVP